MGLLSPARMVVLLLPLLLLLHLDQAQALAKPEQGKPTIKQIFWLTYSFLTKKDQAMFLSLLLPPYLGALFRSTKTEKNTIRKTKMPFPRYLRF